MNVYVLCALELKTRKKMSVCLSVCLYVRGVLL